jgi:hypothetical protein
MKDYSGIIQDIKDNITENGKGEITGRDLREILLEAIGNVSVDMGELDRRIEAILGGENYDDIINSWAELEQFLSGLDESSNLAELLSYKADKSDVYSRSDINAKLEDYTKTDDLGALAFKDEVEMSDIKNLEDALDKKLDKEGGDIENNLLVKGELRMGVLFVPTSDGEPSSYRLAIGELGEGADIPSSGEGGLGSVTIMLGDVPYYSDSNGIVRLPAYPTGGGGVSGDYLPISGGTLVLEGRDSFSVKRNRGEGFGSYIQFENNVGVLGQFGLYRENDSYTAEVYFGNGENHCILHSGNYSDYALPLSGGTMQGNLDLGKNSITNAKELSCYDSGTGYYVGGRNYGLGVTDGGLLLYSYGDTPISFYTYGTEKMRITSGGSVLIGTTNDSGARVTITVPYRNSFPSLGSLGSGSDLSLQFGANYGLYFSVNAQNGSAMIQNGCNDGTTYTYPILLNPLGGNVLIGTTTDNGARLQVNGNIYASGYQLPTSAPSNPVSGGYYLYVGSLGSGAVIS